MEGKTKVYGELVWQDPDRVSGAPCFFGTRVPIQNLLDYLEGDYTVEQFCEIFSISKELALGVLELGMPGVVEKLRAA